MGPVSPYVGLTEPPLGLVQTYHRPCPPTGGGVRRCAALGSTQGTYWYNPISLYCYTATGVGGQFL